MIKYGRNQNKENQNEAKQFNVMVMGAGKIGKTRFIKSLLRCNDNDSQQKVENIYEFREHCNFLNRNEISPDELLRRERIISMGTLFILLYSVNDSDSFSYIEEFRYLIEEKKGKEVPIFCVGLRSDRSHKLKRAISFEYADLVVSLDWENKYYELSLSEITSLDEVRNDIIKRQEEFDRQKANETETKLSQVIKTFRRLLSWEQ